MIYLIKETAFVLDEGWCWYWYKINDTDEHDPETEVILESREGSIHDKRILDQYIHLVAGDECMLSGGDWVAYKCGKESCILDIFLGNRKQIERIVWESPQSELEEDTRLYLEDRVEKKVLMKKAQEDYAEALKLSEDYKKNCGRLRFSDEMKPGRNDYCVASPKKLGDLESSLKVTFKRGKFYTESNILEVLSDIYQDFGVQKTPSLEDLTTEYTVTRVWEDRQIPGYHCKRRVFYVRLA